MFRRPAAREEPEIPHRKLEDEVGVKETVIANGTKIHGTIQGQNNVRVAGFLEGQMIGNIRCNKLALAEGCFIRGEIKMPGEESKPLTLAEKRKTTGDEAGPERDG